ncbi:hypothetical protein POM88_050063 [Heracleum sosnowskyi]|uniref:SNF2 N-terminal domain-containing protein n=1 Tax=Heracleum sosnowskyi TaxID=360622 RepID=A0AAD8M268_9APIA|nr:hypothetical protein POM88_050063 [Heracleum sosnowskyi]
MLPRGRVYRYPPPRGTPDAGIAYDMGCYQNPIANGQHINSTAEDVNIMNQRSHIMYEQLKGFVQRMDMNVVKKDLPPKSVLVIAVKLSPLQRKLYKRFLDVHGFTKGKVSAEKTRNKIEGEDDTDDTSKRIKTAKSKKPLRGLRTCSQANAPIEIEKEPTRVATTTEKQPKKAGTNREFTSSYRPPVLIILRAWCWHLHLKNL